MQVLGIRFCSISAEAEALAGFLDQLGLPRRAMGGDEGAFAGAIFPAGNSWVELWPNEPDMPEGMMLQVVVDDADAFAGHTRGIGLDPAIPRMPMVSASFFSQGPTGRQMSFQSKLEDPES